MATPDTRLDIKIHLIAAGLPQPQEDNDNTDVPPAPRDTIFDQENGLLHSHWHSRAVSPSVIRELENFIRVKLNRPVAPGSLCYSYFEHPRHLIYSFCSTGIDSALNSDDSSSEDRPRLLPDILLRIAKPGLSAAHLSIEKLEGEVAWMKYAKANTCIPIPEIFAYGSGTQNENHEAEMMPLGQPYILMEHLRGVPLEMFQSAIPKVNGTNERVKPEDEDPTDEHQRSVLYEEVAKLYLQMRRLGFSLIGSLKLDRDLSPREWTIQKRPLIPDMENLAVGMRSMTIEPHAWRNAPLESPVELYHEMRVLHQAQLWDHVSLNMPPRQFEPYGGGTIEKPIDLDEVARLSRLRFLARQGMDRVSSYFREEEALRDAARADRSRFLAFNPSLDGFSILVNPDTAKITGVIDFSFTNSFPATFSEDPPLWLLPSETIRLPSGEVKYVAGCRDLANGTCSLADFKKLYEPYLVRFLQAMYRVEAARAEPPASEDGQHPIRVGPPHQSQTVGPREPPLALRMADSWTSGRCWVNFAALHINIADTFYWEELQHYRPDRVNGPPYSDGSTDLWAEVELGAYVGHAKRQSIAHDLHRRDAEPLIRARQLEADRR